MDDTQPPAPMLDYQQPTRNPRRQWGLLARVMFGVLLSLIFTLFVIPIMMDIFGPPYWMLMPLGFVAQWIHNKNTTTTEVIIANGIFWGFLIAFSLGRRKKYVAVE